MNKHVFLPITLLLLFLSLNTFGQRSDKRIYTDSGWWTLGINGGGAWQQGDICAIPGWGAGLDLAKNIYHQPGGLLDLDLRGRLLYTQTYGADHERSYGILENPALNGTNSAVDYTVPNGPGFTFMNNKTHLGEASIEAVLTANRLRENTGVILQGFGGLGLNGYQTYTDQLNYKGEMYNWDDINTDRRRLDVLSQIGTYGYYETPANDYDNAPRISVMPSLGLGLGYQLTRNFSMGIEHKTNWALHDNLEGQLYNREDNTLSTDNDLHHYTSLYLRWRIGDRYKQDPTPVYNDPIGEDEMTTYSGNGNAPIITFTKPRKEVSTVTNDRVSVAANIEHIDGRNNIDARLNGKPLTSYTYNTRNDKFSTVLVLQPGTNEIEITATNRFGKDVESRVINLEERVVDYVPPTTTTPTTNTPNNTPANTSMNKKPRINITRPSANPYNSESQIVKLKANVENVSNKNDITFKINGKRSYNFEMGGYFGNTITADIPLERGTNNVSITARNANGSDNDTQRIIFNETTNTTARPRVRIDSPSANPYNSSKTNVSVTARIENVNSKNDITYTVNGQRRTNFSFNASTDKFASNVTLNGERTEVIIRAVNSGGNDSDDLTIVYCPPYQQAPQVTITKPMSNSHNTQNDRERVTATVTNVNSKADVNIKINNQPILNFEYSNSRNEVTFMANLRPGNNSVRIKATNNVGTDSDDVVINYNAIEKPQVDIIKPNASPYTSTNSSVGIVATVTNVDSKSDITFKVNGRTTNSFSYSTFNGKVTANIDLENGNNTVYIKATNEAGSDNDQTIIKYNKPSRSTNTSQFSGVETPTVNIIKPNTNPYTSTSEKAVVTATITNVSSSKGITFTVNGNEISDFQYSASLKKFQGRVNLVDGNNKVVITGRNGSKTASDNITIKYQGRTNTNGQFGTTYNSTDDGEKTTRSTTTPRPRGGLGKKGSRKSSGKKANKATVSKPTIKVLSPAGLRGKTTRESSAKVELKLTGTARDNIEIYLNGKKTNEFEFNAKRGVLKGTYDLKKGVNTIEIKAKNKGGEATKKINITRL